MVRRAVAVALQTTQQPPLQQQIASIQKPPPMQHSLPHTHSTRAHTLAAPTAQHTMMERKTRLLLLVFAAGAALLAISSTSTAAAGLSSSAGALQGMPSSTSALHALRRVEDDESSRLVMESAEEAAYPRRRALYASGYITFAALSASQAACYGPCPARGQAYTGRGCLAIYQCRG